MSDKTKRILIYVTIGILLLGTLVYWIINRDNDDHSQRGDESTQLDNDASAVEQPDTNDPNIPDVKEEPNESQPDNISSGNNPQYVPTISRVSQDDNNVFVRAYVSTFDEGMCRLEMTKGSDKISKTSDVTPQPSYLQCDGFTVQKSELSNGNWQIKVIYELNGTNYESESQSFTVS